MFTIAVPRVSPNATRLAAEFRARIEAAVELAVGVGVETESALGVAILTI